MSPDRPVWAGDMDPTLSQILRHLFNSDMERAKMSEELGLLRAENEALKLTVENYRNEVKT